MEGRSQRSRGVEGAAPSHLEQDVEGLQCSLSSRGASHPPPILFHLLSLPSLCPAFVLLHRLSFTLSVPSRGLCFHPSQVPRSWPCGSRWAGTSPHARRCERTSMPHSKPTRQTLRLSPFHGCRDPGLLLAQGCTARRGKGRGPRWGRRLPSLSLRHAATAASIWASNAPACALQVTCTPGCAWTL